MLRLVLMFTLLVSSVVQSESVAPITLGSIDQAPWGWQDRNQQSLLHGATIDFSKQLGDHLGVTIRPQIYPYPRLLKIMEKKQIDLALFLASNQPEGAIAIAKAIEVNVQLTSTKRIDTNEITKLSQYKIGHLAGGKYGKNLSPLISGKYFTPLNSYEQGLELMHKGRLDAILGLAYTVNQAIEKQTIKPPQLHHQTISTEEVWLYASSSFDENSALILNIRNSMQAMRESGEMDEIAKRNFIKAKTALLKQ